MLAGDIVHKLCSEVPRDEYLKSLLVINKDGPLKDIHFMDSKLVSDIKAAEELCFQRNLTGIYRDQNKYETLGKLFFQNRAAVKMANLDSIVNMKLTNPSYEVNGVRRDLVKESDILLFADMCGNPGGFSEYVLWQKRGLCKGFGLTLIIKFDFDNIKAGPPELLHPYGKDGLCDITNKDTPAGFKTFMKLPRDGGVHLVMSDGGFGKKDIKESLSLDIQTERLIGCQFFISLSVLAANGNFVCKLFELTSQFLVGLVYLMSMCFKETLIVKPATSRPHNNERYIIFLNRHKDVDRVLQHLSSLNTDFPFTKHDSNEMAEEIFGVVNAHMMLKDKHFINFLNISNNDIGSKRLRFLSHVANSAGLSVCKDSIRKSCLDLWKIKNVDRKIFGIVTRVEDFFNEASFASLIPHALPTDPVDLQKHGNYCIPMFKKDCVLLATIDDGRTFTKFCSSSGCWKTMETIGIPRRSVLIAEVDRAYWGGQIKSIIVHDVLKWFSVDLTTNSFLSRNKLIPRLLDAVKENSMLKGTLAKPLRECKGFCRRDGLHQVGMLVCELSGTKERSFILNYGQSLSLMKSSKR